MRTRTCHFGYLTLSCWTAEADKRIRGGCRDVDCGGLKAAGYPLQGDEGGRCTSFHFSWHHWRTVAVAFAA